LNANFDIHQSLNAATFSSDWRLLPVGIETSGIGICPLGKIAIFSFFSREILSRSASRFYLDFSSKC